MTLYMYFVCKNIYIFIYKKYSRVVRAFLLRIVLGLIKYTQVFLKLPQVRLKEVLIGLKMEKSSSLKTFENDITSPAALQAGHQGKATLKSSRVVEVLPQVVKFYIHCIDDRYFANVITCQYVFIIFVKRKI